MKAFPLRCLALLFVVIASVQGATPQRGSERLRELVVYPQLNFKLSFDMNFDHNKTIYVIEGSYDNHSNELAMARQALRRQPDGVAQILTLADLLDDDGNTNEAKTLYQSAEQIVRRKVAANPNNGPALTELGVCLSALEKNEEAQSAFRKATLVSSNEWKCWIGLGNSLQAMIYGALQEKAAADQKSILNVLMNQDVKCYPSAADLEKAKQFSSEAFQCFQRAKAIAPKEPEVWIQSAGYSGASNLLALCASHIQNGEAVDATKYAFAYYSPATTYNLERALELRPRDSELLGLVTFLEWTKAMFLQGDPDKFTPAMLPDDARHSLMNKISSLEKLSHDPDRETATTALMCLASLNMSFKDYPAAVSNLQRLVALDPSDDTAQGLLLGIRAQSATPNDLLAIAESWVKANHTYISHVALGKVLAKMSKWNRAGEEAQTAYLMDTNDVVTPLLLGAIALKQSADTNQLNLAIAELRLASENLGKLPGSDENRGRKRELMLDTIIAAVLSGSPDGQSLAKRYLDALLQEFPNDEVATGILSAIGSN